MDNHLKQYAIKNKINIKSNINLHRLYNKIKKKQEKIEKKLKNAYLVWYNFLKSKHKTENATKELKMIFKDYYTILGLENSKVSLQEIKIAFREQAKKYHPDINKKNPTAEERFKDINEAYKILSEDKTKKKYDRIWNAKVGRKKVAESNGEKRPSGSAVNEFFNMFFGPTTRNQS